MARVATGVGIAVGVGVGCGVGCGWQRGAVGREGRILGVVSWRCGGAGVPLAAAARAVGWGDGTGVCQVPVLRQVASAGVVLRCAGHRLWGRSGPRLVGHGVAHQSTQNQQHNHPQIKSTAHQPMIGRAGNGSRPAGCAVQATVVLDCADKAMSIWIQIGFQPFLGVRKQLIFLMKTCALRCTSSPRTMAGRVVWSCPLTVAIVCCGAGFFLFFCRSARVPDPFCLPPGPLHGGVLRCPATGGCAMPSAVTQDAVMLRAIGLASFASMAAMRVCDPMLVTLSQEFAVSTGDASATVAAFAVAYGVLQLFYGPLGDRLGKLRVIAAAAAGCALFSAITALAPSLSLLVLARAAMGATAAGVIPLSMAWIGDQVPDAQRQEVLARLMGATLSGMMFGQWFGGFAAQHWGWRTAFMVISLLFVVAALGLYRQLRSGQGASAAGAAAGAVQGAAAQSSALAYVHKTLALLRIPRVRWVLAVTAIEGTCAFGTLAFVPSRMVEGFGLSAAAAGAVVVVYGVGGLLYSLLARHWLAWLGAPGLAQTGGVLVAAGLMALAWSPWVQVAVAGCFFSGLGFYMLHNTLQTQATQMAPEARGTAVTLFACLLFLGQSCGVLLMAASVDRGLLSPMFSLAALGLGVLGTVVARKQHVSA